MLSRLLGRELIRRRQPFVSTVMMLTLSFAALLFSLSLRESHLYFVNSKAEEVLTGNVQVTSSRAFTAAEEKAFKELPQVTKTSREIEMFGSVRFAHTPSQVAAVALCELKAIEDDFPLKGRVLLQNGVAHAKDLKENQIWMAQELLDASKSKINDEVQIGDGHFQIAGAIVADVGLAHGATGFAPRVYWRIPAAQKSGLIQVGSQVQYQLTFLTQGQSASALRETLNPWPDEIIVRTPEDALSGLKRSLDQIETYMFLMTTFIALLGFIVAFYLLQLSLQKNTAHYANYTLYGLKLRNLIFMVAGLTLTLTTIAAGLAFALITPLQYLINMILSYALAYDLHLFMSWVTLAKFAAIAAAMGIILAGPYLLNLQRLDLNGLLNSQNPLIPSQKQKQIVVFTGSTLLLFFVVIGLILEMPRVLAILGVAILPILALAYWGLPIGVATYIKSRRPQGMLRVAMLQLTRARLVTSLLWLTLCLTTCIGYIGLETYTLMETKLTEPATFDLPQLFVVNLREADLNPLTQSIAKLNGRLSYVSPLVLARLININNTPTEGRLSKFPVRLTYREQLQDSEQIVAGSALPRLHTSGTPGVSVEVDFAERNNLKIGDLLDFEISGLPIKAVIANLREVKWNSFQPNFFLQFTKGVLDDFPKSFLGVVYGLEPQRLYQIHAQLAANFPNVTWLNVSDTISRLNDLAKKFSIPIVAVTLVMLMVILLMVIFLGWRLNQEKREERQLFMNLGVTQRSLQQIYRREYGILYGSATFTGLAFGVVGYELFATKLFASIAQVHLLNLVSVSLVAFVALLLVLNSPE